MIIKKYICIEKQIDKEMIHTKHCIRVRYGETDPMKYVYYGNYAEYFEVARVELFRSIGMAYSDIEHRGIWLPVSEYKIKYLKPALYDEILEIHTYIKKIPSVRIEFEYEIFNSKGEKITQAQTTLFFMDAEKQKICRCPDFLTELMLPYFKS
ncbi:acyl-CoA thioester hydrolase [Riemerella columbipharyngis]|uniref:Acyl-CoA thioester hydrolase n=2 Tax=Riemerella columbipharyngis TaxID=1071918 RepID=A0A1G6ZBV8_9FLAO|nr:acyl-CoA thioester hydrolase [Riemerella columbipharyngis]